MTPLPRLGVAICTYNSADVILDCLESLLGSKGVRLSIVVADNASTDGTFGLLRDWAAGRIAYQVPSACPFDFQPVDKPLPLDLEGGQAVGAHWIRVIKTGVNGGFAAGVNAALAVLSGDPTLERFWILNPDCMVPEASAQAFAGQPAPDGFALMGGRLNYLDDPDRIQIDGGTINRWTGVTGNLNLDASHLASPPPDPARIDFITGASMVASRQFYQAAGAMPEQYFLYYEEVDWALRRGGLPLIYCSDALVYHRAGTATGSANLGRPASPFSLYFKHRSRLRFMRRHFKAGVPSALLFSIVKAGQLWLGGYRPEAAALLAGSFGLPPAKEVRRILSQDAQDLAL